MEEGEKTGIDYFKVQELPSLTPSYEKWLKNILKVFSYDFAKEFYNFYMNNAVEYTKKLLGDDNKMAMTRDFDLSLKLHFLLHV